jgi:hypothetical protein
MQEEYGNAPTQMPEQETANPEQPGGFLAGADDVVQAFSLPRYVHEDPSTLEELNEPQSTLKIKVPPRSKSSNGGMEQESDEDDDMEEVVIPDDPKSTPLADSSHEQFPNTRKRGRIDETSSPTDGSSRRSSRKRVAPAAAPESTPSRSLRPRRSKTAAQLQEEKEMELAIRRAME